MPVELERRIRATNNVEDKNTGYYDGCIYETDEDGNQIGPDLVPYEFECSFTAKEINYRRSIDGRFDPDRYQPETGLRNFPVPMATSETIHCTLAPGYFSNGSLSSSPRYSFLGTSSLIAVSYTHLTLPTNREV